MKKLQKLKQRPKPVKLNYELSWRNAIVANSISEAYDQCKVILADLEKLVKWEKEGKISAECGDSSPSFQMLEVLDKSIEPELQKVGIVCWYETEVDEYEEEPETQSSEGADSKEHYDEKGVPT